MVPTPTLSLTFGAGEVGIDVCYVVSEQTFPDLPQHGNNLDELQQQHKNKTTKN